MAKPRCKCGRVCAYYGKIGGFSKSCKQCNAKHAKWQRDRRLKLKTQQPSMFASMSLFWDEAAKVCQHNAVIERALQRNRRAPSR